MHEMVGLYFRYSVKSIADRKRKRREKERKREKERERKL